MGEQCPRTPVRIQTFGDYFTPRQLVALTSFSDLVAEAMERVERDAANADLPKDERPLRDGGAGTTAYAEAMGVYLAFALKSYGKHDLHNRSYGRRTVEQTVTAFARQAISMTWDFPEVNPFAGAAGDYSVSVDGVIKGMTSATELNGFATQQNARLSAHQY